MPGSVDREVTVRLVVTGAAGFIGSHLTRALAARGHDVIGIDRRPGVPAPARALLCDLARPHAAACAALAGADGVFHLAGRPGVRDRSPGIECLRRRDNVAATARVLTAVPLTVPVVVASSSSVYGGALHDGVLAPSSEDDELRPRGGYARSKVELEHLCAQRRRAGGVVATVRPFTVAGERGRPDMAIARWLDALARGEPVRVFGSLERRRDVTDVRDVVEGMIRAFELRFSGVVNLGSGCTRTLAEILDAVCRAAGRTAEVMIEPAGEAEVPVTWADTRRMREVLGIEPSRDLYGLVERQARAASGARTDDREVV